MSIVIPTSDAALVWRWRKATLEISALVSEYGLVKHDPQLRGFDPEALSRFQAFTTEKQAAMVHYLEIYCEVLQLQSKRLSANAKFLQKGLDRLGWSIDKEVWGHITDEQVIEIYSTEFIQVFRNLRFMEICNYTLEQVMTYEWWELYRREDRVNEEIAEAANSIFRGKNKLLQNVGSLHRLDELFSPVKATFYMDEQFLSPVYNKTRQVIALLSCCKAGPVEADFDPAHGLPTLKLQS